MTDEILFKDQAEGLRAARLRAAEAAKQGKKLSELLEDWFEMHLKTANKRGAKVIHARRTASAVCRSFVGRSEEPLVKALLRRLQRESPEKLRIL